MSNVKPGEMAIGILGIAKGLVFHVDFEHPFIRHTDPTITVWSCTTMQPMNTNYTHHATMTHRPSSVNEGVSIAVADNQLRPLRDGKSVDAVEQDEEIKEVA